MLICFLMMTVPFIILVKKCDEEMAELDEFLNSYLRFLSNNDKQKALDIIGNIAEGG